MKFLRLLAAVFIGTLLALFVCYQVLVWLAFRGMGV